MEIKIQGGHFFMKTTIRELWEEKQEVDKKCEHVVLQSREWDSIAGTILHISKETTELTAEEVEAVNWAKKRLGY